MNLTKEEIENIFIEVSREKGEVFLEKYHQNRMKQFKELYSEHYAKMTKEELLEAEEKEKEIIDKYFLETYEYPYTIGETNKRCTGDGIPQSTMQIMEKYFVDFFYESFDAIEVKNTSKELELHEVADVLYKMTAEIVIFVKMVGNYNYHYIDNRFSVGNKNRIKPTIQRKIEDLKEILGINMIDSPLHNELGRILDEVNNNIDAYLVPEYKLLTSELKKQYLHPLKKYLNELLPKKKTLIDKFIFELIKDIQKNYEVPTNRK